MTVIIDYGVGNLFSLKSSFAAIGEEASVSSDENVILSADRVILPGVGAFSALGTQIGNTINNATEEMKPKAPAGLPQFRK